MGIFEADGPHDFQQTGDKENDPGHKAPVMGPSPDEIRSRVVPQGG